MLPVKINNNFKFLSNKHLVPKIVFLGQVTMFAGVLGTPVARVKDVNNFLLILVYGVTQIFKFLWKQLSLFLEFDVTRSLFVKTFHWSDMMACLENLNSRWPPFWDIDAIRKSYDVMSSSWGPQTLYAVWWFNVSKIISVQTAQKD